MLIPNNFFTILSTRHKISYLIIFAHFRTHSLLENSFIKFFVSVYQIGETISIHLVELFSVYVYTVCPGSSDPLYITSLLYKMGHYFLDILYKSHEKNTEQK